MCLVTGFWLSVSQLLYPKQVSYNNHSDLPPPLNASLVLVILVRFKVSKIFIISSLQPYIPLL